MAHGLGYGTIPPRETPWCAIYVLDWTGIGAMNRQWRRCDFVWFFPTQILSGNAESLGWWGFIKSITLYFDQRKTWTIWSTRKTSIEQNDTNNTLKKRQRNAPTLSVNTLNSGRHQVNLSVYHHCIQTHWLSSQGPTFDLGPGFGLNFENSSTWQLFILNLIKIFGLGSMDLAASRTGLL